MVMGINDFAVVLATCVLLFPGGRGFEFVYREGEADPVDVVRREVVLDGSHGSLGDWPHWCLGNLNRCPEGFTLDMWVRFTEAAEDSRDVIVFTSGGHMWYSNGVYLLQRFGDEYELGVAWDEDIWAVQFRVRPSVWVNIHAVWDLTSGLTLLTPAYEQTDSMGREFQHFTFDSFMDVEIGLYTDGRPLTDDVRFEIASLRIYNWLSTMPSDGIDMNKLWMGCKMMDTPDSAYPVPLPTAAEACRQLCSGKAIATISTDGDCACATLEALENAQPDTSLCNNETDWQLYSVSGLSETNSGYEITVSVHKLGNKDYVKPFEAVEIRISTNFVLDVTFIVDFGDGNIEKFVDNIISYYWTEEGKYDITVSTTIGIAQVSGSADFLVQDVDEGYAGDFVMLGAYHGNQSRQANIDFLNIDKETALCDIRFGDSGGVDQRRIDLSDYVETASLFHEYGQIGRYVMSVECNNPYGAIQNETYFTARKLDRTYHFLEQGKQFNSTAVGDETFFDSTLAMHNDPNFVITLRQDNMRTLILDPTSMRLQENYVNYKFNGDIVDSRIINVQNVLQRPTISSLKLDGAWNLTTAITITLPPGNNMFVNVSFGLGVGEMFYIHYQPNFTAIEFMVNFTELGYYPMHANISNDVSFNTAESLVSVEVPLAMMSLSISDVIDKENPAILIIDVNDGMQGPMKINFEIDHGNGYVDTFFHYNDKYFFEPFRHEYKYPDWGDYVVCVRAFNNLGSVFDCINVRVGQQISYVDITTPTAGRFVPGDIVTSIIRCPQGSDKMFRIDFGDGDTFVFTDRYLVDTENFIDTTTMAQTTSALQVSTDGTYPNGNAMLENSSTTTIPNTDNTTLSVNNSTSSPVSITPMSSETTSTATKFTTSEEIFPVRRRREAFGTETVTEDPATTTGQATTTHNGATYGSSTMYHGPNATTHSQYSYPDNNSNSQSSVNMSNTNSSGKYSHSDVNSTYTTETLVTSTTAPPTTTTFMPSTMEPIPDDALWPHFTNDSTARSRRDGTILLTHKYRRTGTYPIKVSVSNTFNWASDELCPPIIVANATVNTTCMEPLLSVSPRLESSSRNPLQFYRSEQINLTATASFTGCGTSKATYSWRTDRLVVDNGRTISRPYQDSHICVLGSLDKMFKYPKSTLPFGEYVATLVVSPDGHPLQTATYEFYFTVRPSPPHAVIDGNREHMWFLVYGTTMIKFSKSIDPDFNTTDGITYDLVVAPETKLSELKQKTLPRVKESSSLVMEGITHKYTSKNPVNLYQFDKCFREVSGNLTKDIRFTKGQFFVPSEYFEESVSSFALILYVSKNNLTTSAHATFEIRLSNASNLLDQLDDLLASKDTTGVMRAVTALSGLLVTESTNSSEEENFEAQEAMTELKAKLIGALDSVSEGVADIDQASGMIGLVDDLTKDGSSVSDNARESATNAIKNSAEITEGFADEPMNTLTDVGSKVVSGVSNVLPKPDATEALLAAHKENIRQAEADAKAVMGPTDEEIANGEAEEEGADIKLDDDEVELTELTEEEMASTAPLPYNKLLKRCDLLHSPPLDKLYKYLFFYESIFRSVLKNISEEIMVSAEILKLARNDIFCYIGVLEEPGDVEWYYNRFFDKEKRRRDLIKKNADRGVSKSFLSSIDSVSSVLLNKTDANQTVELSAKGLKVSMKRASANGSDDESMGDGGAGVRMPTGILSGSGNDSEVGQTLIMNDDNPFTYGNENDTTSIGTGVVTFKLSTPGTKNEVPVSNTTEPIEIYLGTSATLLADPKLYTLILRQGDSQSSMVYHPINVTNNDTTIHMVVRPEMRDSEDLFDILIQYESRPNDTNYMVQTTLPHPEDAFTAYNLTWEKEDEVRHTFFPDAELTRLAGMYYVGVRLRSGKVDLSSEETMFNYTYRHFLGGCRFWNHENETWESDGCMVGNLTTYNATQCLCTHLTSFGGEMVVPPNTIDFNNVWAKFKDLNENAAVFSTIVSLLGVYVIGLIWARHMDKKDLIKWGATPLEDNLPTDNYHYQVSVYTGMKKNSGTKSSISFILSGEVHDTGVRRMFDGKRQTHGKGSIMNYVLSVEQKLGPLSFCRVWHDNSGDSAWRSWYLEQIVLSLRPTDRREPPLYFFLCNRWLACEEDDGMVDRILPVASIEDLVAFKQLFSSSVRKKLSSDHLWLSVFSRPTRSSFTRVQRISCCMSLLFLTMITNAMWFKSDGEKGDDSQKQVVSMSIGPITFTLSQIFISLASTIIVFPPSFLLITLFRRTKQKKNTVMQANQTKPKRGKWKNLGTSNSRTNMWGPEPKESKFKKFKESINELVKGGNKNKYDPQEEDFDSIPAPTIAGDPNAKKIRAKKKKKPFMFPHWCNYIAWVLCFFSVIAPAFFTILYSMEWGKTKANEWLVTFVLSFFQSVIVVQPIKKPECSEEPN